MEMRDFWVFQDFNAERSTRRRLRLKRVHNANSREPNSKSLVHLLKQSSVSAEIGKSLRVLVMERNKILPPTTLFVVFLLLAGMAKMAESQFRGPPMPSRPLCLSQFALANHACSLLPYGPNPYEPLPPSDEPDDPDEVLHVDSDHHDSNNGGDHDHGRRRGHAHRHRLSGEERRRRHRHHRHHETPIEEDCCRWLRAVDDQCVCEVLVHLPVFLARPWHRYQVVVDASCNVTYDCAGRVIGL